MRKRVENCPWVSERRWLWAPVGGLVQTFCLQLPSLHSRFATTTTLTLTLPRSRTTYTLLIQYPVQCYVLITTDLVAAAFHTIDHFLFTTHFLPLAFRIPHFPIIVFVVIFPSIIRTAPCYDKVITVTTLNGGAQNFNSFSFISLLLCRISSRYMALCLYILFYADDS